MKNITALIIGILLILVTGCKDKNIRNIVVIGDSNGASHIGWVVKLDSMLTSDNIINYSIGGNTIGFDNNGKEKLNALKNIRKNLSDANDKVDQIDLVIVALGTNDCKAVFDSLLDTVPVNMERLIDEIQNFQYKNNIKPNILIVSPPEVGQDSMLLPKYYGIRHRLDILIPKFEAIAFRMNCNFVDVRKATKNNFDKLTVDGIHFNDKGYSVIADQILQKIE